MSKFLQFAQQMLRQNQGQMPNTPWTDSAVNAIMNGDARAGQALANNICKNMGMTREQAIAEAKKQFNIPF